MRHVESLQVAFDGRSGRGLCFGTAVLLVYGIEMGDAEGGGFAIVVGYVLDCGDCCGVLASAHEEFGALVEMEDKESEDKH